MRAIITCQRSRDRQPTMTMLSRKLIIRPSCPALIPSTALYQHDYLSYLHCGRAPLPLTFAIRAGLSAVEIPVARPVSLAALAAVHPILRSQPKQLAPGLLTFFRLRVKP